MKPAPLLMWAVIVKSKRVEWIHWHTIDRIRAQAWQKYREQWTDPKVADDHAAAGEVRLAKVTVSLQAK